MIRLFMVRLFIALCIGAGALLAQPERAAACGLKASTLGPRTKKLTPATDHPSKILLLGQPSRRTVAVLNEAGHSIEIASDAESVHGQTYHVIVADAQKVAEAREGWPGVIVVPADGSSNDVLNRVEAELDRDPNRKLVARVPIRSSLERRPIATSSSEGDTAGPSVRVATGGSSPSGESRRPIATGGGATLPVPTTNEMAVATTTPPVAGATAERTAPAAPRDPSLAPKSRRGERFYTHIYFANASAELSERHRVRLRTNATWLAKNPDKTVTVEGHTNTTGAAAANQVLAERRSEVVKQFLAEHGVDASRIEIKAYGKERPEFRPGENPRNRRVVIVIDR